MTVKSIDAFLLSCLCGSELVVQFQDTPSKLLSCLCGSELDDKTGEVIGVLLSCLCGSELTRTKKLSIK